ncbi:ArdC family protein [Desulfovibrio ferrophilus]|uniref:Antirestriction protein n=1 Tax=Desulfovibrio ferrophilus TaxID=241368 RepID=A0A2Z6B3M0_9BACT|nr:zincin-like metallopeptidase domain-containing protein [Desulfovibrio ferrophilus]BBD10107.1 uncharacterized protein DFE_A0006 [Desulfovibrio ferrophilus]
MATKQKLSVYELVTNRILSIMEENKELPWHKPWAGGSAGRPMSFHSQKAYRGVNVFLLTACGFASPYWLTFKQTQARGGNVMKGQKGCPVVFFKWFKTRDRETGLEKEIPMLRYYTVFNAEQIEGIDFPSTEEKEQTPDFTPIDTAQQIIDAMPCRPEITHMEASASYSSTWDRVNLPKPELFESETEYYCTAFHELVHSTGHETRLNRVEGMNSEYGDHSYSKEELTAEMGAAMLCAEAGILMHTEKNSAAYLKGWSRKLRNNPRWLVQAASQAQKAVDLILDNAAPQALPVAA